LTSNTYGVAVQEYLHATELFIRPRDLSEAAKLNLFRLFSQRTPEPGLFAEWCEELYQLYAGAFISKDYLTDRHILDFVPHNTWPLTREEAGQHLSNAYFFDEFSQLDWSRSVARSVVKCLELSYRNLTFGGFPKDVKLANGEIGDKGT
jgi:hypothetical protein